MNDVAMRSVNLRGVLSPAEHAVLDYSVAAGCFALGWSLASRRRPGAGLSFLNGALIVGMSMLTDYPGGVYPLLSFQAHRTADIGQAILTAAGPALMGFADEPEAAYFYSQAAGEAAVIAATDWTAGPDALGR